jgi:hypothetical protein
VKISTKDGVNNIYETTGTGLDDGPFDPNPDQANGDGDPTGDACDDSEGDTFFDSTVNCDTNSNPNQTDTDADGQGNPCDHDEDNDSVNDELDNCPNTRSPNQTDSDRDEIGDACDSLPNGEDIPPGPDTDISTQPDTPCDGGLRGYFTGDKDAVEEPLLSQSLLPSSEL